jgi:hypothetical protein
LGGQDRPGTQNGGGLGAICPAGGFSGPVSGLIYINMQPPHLRDHDAQQDSGRLVLMGPAKAAILAGVNPVTYCFKDAQ